MQKAERHLLSTRPLPEALLQQAAGEGIAVDCRSFIETDAVSGPEFGATIQALARTPHTVVFTSMNAVEAVAAYLNTAPHWQAYSIGHSTRQLVSEKLGIPVKGEAPDAAALTQVILEAGEKHLLFFCGNLRRDTLPLTLKAHKVRVEELMVYRTRLTGSKVEKDYDGILFYSPSAVESFFGHNLPVAGTVYFAIGATTAAALRDAGAEQIVVATRPGKEALLQQAIRHFTNFTKNNNDNR